MNAALRPKRSAIAPTDMGSSAPPNTATHNRPEVALRDTPERSSVIEKIVGNMIELKKPIASAGRSGQAGPHGLCAAGGQCQFQVFEGCEHEWVATPGPQTDRAREMVKAFIARHVKV